MKTLYKILLGMFVAQIVIIPAVALTPSVTSRVTPSPSPEAASASALLQTAAVGTDEANIRDLRDKLASRVAELRKKDVRVIAGEVIEVAATTLQLQTVYGTKEEVELDPALTKYFRITGAAKEEVEQKTVTVGQYAIVNGPKSEGRVSANEVYLDETFESKAGKVVEVDTKKGTLKLETFDKESLTVDILKTTVQQSMNSRTFAVVQGGLSQVKEGDTVHVVYRVKTIREKSTTVSAFRMLHIPNSFFVQ